MANSLRLAAFALAAPLLAQGNQVPGTDIRIFDVGSPTVYGRRGAPYPNGEVAMAVGHSMCNTGTVHLPWVGWVSGSGSVMVDTYPKIAFLLARDSGGRMVQVSDKAHLKHSRVAFNFSGGPCGPCQSGPSQHFRVGCYDVYSTGFNGNQFNLGPTDEIDPWQGSWNPQGSYFDRGDPSVGGAQASDSIQSLTTSGFDQFKNRMLVREQELAVAGASFFAQAQVVAKGEPGTVRGNNLASRQVSIAWNGSSWSAALAPAAAVQGSVLQRWNGATVTSASNGTDDGHFVVGVKVTGPVDGVWHYEYAIHNQDNHRGAAAVRIPICPSASLSGAGFRDIDADPLNTWTASLAGGELAMHASANNPLDWNCIYNIWFDSDAAPVAGTLSIDQARIGPGALTVSVPTQVPGRLSTESLGDACGTPAPQLFAVGEPSSPNPAFAMQVQANASSLVVFAFAGQAASVPLAGACSLWLDESTLIAAHLVQANASGHATFPLPIPAGLAPLDIPCQAFELVPGGPIAGFLAATNGLRIRAAAITSCP